MRKRATSQLLTPLFLQLLAGGSAAQGEADDLWQALAEGEVSLKFRYRYELVDQGGFASDAHASTLRTLLTFSSAPYHGLVGTLEFEDVSPVFDDRLYDSSVNGHTDRPVVLDPDTTEINQVFLDYSGVEDARAKLGRQRIVLDNARFIGNVGWRQNEQTYDAVRLGYDGFEGLTADYVFLHNVNRVVGDPSPAGDAAMASHLVRLAYPVEGVADVTAYYYHLDYDALDALSSGTVGIRLDGAQALDDEWGVEYELELASQTDVGDNPNDVDATYYHLAVTVDHGAFGATVGYESLGGGAVGAGDKFQTPLATLHGFNGWADKFTATPDTGLEDLYFGLHGEVAGADLAAIWHDFGPESGGGGDYGTELDLLATYTVDEHLRFGVKAALYDADTFDLDTDKFWVWVEVSP